MKVKRIKINSLNRIGGHLKIEVEVDKGKVVNAWSSGTMARGFEVILRGKDPRDAPFITSRFCGVCHSVHALASSKALEDAFKINVPDGARILRNLIMGAEYIYDHILHFYHLSCLDYVDFLKVSEYRGNDPELLSVKDKVMALVNKGETFPFTPRYQPDAFSVRDSEVATTLLSHYLEALKIQAEARNMGAIFGGRQPHYQSLVLGGITQLPDAEKIARFQSFLSKLVDFIRNTYLSDVLALGTGPLLPLAQTGMGGGHLNYLSFGAFELDSEGKEKLFKPGVIFKGDLQHIREFNPERIRESVRYSWYRDTSEPLLPLKGETEYDLDKKDAYSFVKAPRYEGKPMEVGPLARLLVMQEKTLLSLLKEKKVKLGVVTRHVARAIETLMVGEKMLEWLEELALKMGKPDFKIYEEKSWRVPESGEGTGFYEAPRGALGHWIKIKGRKIQNYQAIAPSTWNASPRDENGVRGQCEEALIGVPVPDPENPINIVRVIRSFDPCLACAVHLIEPVSNKILKFQI